MKHGRNHLMLVAALAVVFTSACSEPTAGSDLFSGAGGGGGAGGEGGAGTTSSRATSTTGGGTTTSVTTTSTSSGGACDADELACSDGTCVFDVYACDGFLDCLDGSDEYPSNPSCPAPTTTTSTSTGGPSGWTCNVSFYGTGDGCDCGCGILDADCASGSAELCEYCTNVGSCALFGCDEIDRDQNWLCGE